MKPSNPKRSPVEELSLFGKLAAFGVAISTTALMVSDAEAQTVGMERRHARRVGRHERREVRRTGTTTGMAK